MLTQPHFGAVWFDALADGLHTGQPAIPESVRVGTLRLGAERALLLAVVPDPQARFPRARSGEVGLEEGWAVADVVRQILQQDRKVERPRPIVVLVDVPSQAYGYVEELAGIHQSLAGAVHALATARLSGHPVVALVVGQAISGAFLAIGLQANRIVVLDHDGVVVQVMSKPSAARITRRSIEELDAMARLVPATAYDGASFAALGAVHHTAPVERPAQPGLEDILRVRAAVADAVASARQGPPDLRARLESPEALTNREASIRVRRLVAQAWNQ
ncbi:biotin-independent malonate decarboxylase subunit gamma [Micromonospora sp. NPDC047707]|uniref:biotin-independent malonate decarboxylase subunit gamma n=1 Tax=Micromonospora sp. NPDC047707 TaxID=3154498 RepID=UPI003453379A